MARERLTRRQKDVAGALRKRRQLFRENLIVNRKNRSALTLGKGQQR